MSQNSVISITLKMSDGNGFKKITMDADGLKKVMSDSIVTADKLKNSMFDLAAVCTSVDSVNKLLQETHAILKEWSDAYTVQQVAETKLETTMRNTMGAREEDIQSIKDLCAAQQELGVIGDEVQISGAQQMAKYLSEKQSLEQLIPVMNDMLAQQYGLNATQENAVQIATVLGKAMSGQSSSLKKPGYSLSEAQENIIKYGTESE